MLLFSMAALAGSHMSVCTTMHVSLSRVFHSASWSLSGDFIGACSSSVGEIVGTRSCIQLAGKDIVKYKSIARTDIWFSVATEVPSNVESKNSFLGCSIKAKLTNGFHSVRSAPINKKSISPLLSSLITGNLKVYIGFILKKLRPPLWCHLAPVI